jgi:hypothetical protein
MNLPIQFNSIQVTPNLEKGPQSADFAKKSQHINIPEYNY